MRARPPRRQRCILALGAGWLGLALTTLPSTAGAQAPTPADESARIQVLASYHRGNPWTDELLERLDDAVEQLALPPLDVDYLDARRLGRDRAFALQHARLGGRPAVTPSDRLLLMDDAALAFYLQSPAALQAPSRVVALGINDPALQDRAVAAGVKLIETTGVGGQSVAFLGEAFGGPIPWLVLGDDAPVGRDLTEAFLRHLEASPAGRLVGRLEDWTPATVRDALDDLPPETRVYLVAGLTTGRGDRHLQRRGWLHALEEEGVPVFCHLPYLMPLGCDGGTLLDTRRVALLALETLLSPAFAQRPDRQVVRAGQRVLDARWHAEVPASMASSVEWIGVDSAMQHIEAQRSRLMWLAGAGGGVLILVVMIMTGSRRRAERRQHHLMTDHATGLPSQQLWEVDAPTRGGCLFELASPQLRDARRRFGLSAAQSLLREHLPGIRASLPDGWRLYAGTSMNLLGWMPAETVAGGVEPRLDAALARLGLLTPPEGGQRLSWHASLLCLDAAEDADIALCRDALDEGVRHIERGGWQQPLRRVLPCEPASATRFRFLAEALEALLESGPAGQWRLAFQPQFDARGHSLRGAEALLRWRHPEAGDISPGEFLPVVDSLGMAGQLDAWVSREAVAWLSRHRDRLKDGFRLSINVGLATLEDGRFVTELAAALHEASLEARWLEIEITEHADFGELVRIERAMEQLRRLGVRVSLDDFGTGYTAFRLLQRLPFDAVKLDRELLQSAGRHLRAIEAYEAMVSFCRQLGLEIVAEGVETEEQVQWLASLDIQLLQGFHLGRPAESADFLTAYGRPRLSGVGL